MIIMIKILSVKIYILWIYIYDKMIIMLYIFQT